MDDLIDAIRAAVATGASDEVRTAGASACRTILAALEATPGQPMAAPDAPSVPAPLAAVVAALRGMPPEQLLDTAIARLKAALPDAQMSPPVRFHLVPIGGKR